MLRFGWLARVFVVGLGLLTSTAGGDENALPENESLDASTRLATRDAALSPTESLAAFVTSPDIRVELVACEPEVIDPVATRFDLQGRLWVVEMRDYPTGPQSADPSDSTAGEHPPSFNGTIRILRDLDQDGVYEHSVVFADHLVFPTGIQPWRDGVIVTLAGRIAYMADTDGDDVCNVKETWFTGFAEDNEQLRANHPTLGIDGLVYVAGGLRGGTIEPSDPRWPKRDEPVRLVHADFAFDPNGGYFGAVSGDSQYGLSIDDFGNRIGVSNRNPGKLAALPLSLVSHDPWLNSSDVVFDVSPSGADSSVHPIAESWTTSNLHAGQFSAACAVHRIAASGLPKSWQGDLLCCEPTAYLVQRARVDDSDAIPKSTAVLDPGEAIASRDAWFRPVDLVDGPAGCVYLVDMHRAVIEHPQWVPDELKHRVDERWGNDCGRIFRIRSAQHKFASTDPAIKDADPRSLVSLLDSPDRWLRSEASRRLYEHGANSAAPLRESLMSLKTPSGLSRATSLLASIQALQLADIERLANDANPAVRSIAAKLATQISSGTNIASRLARDEAASVRLAAVTSLASLDSPLDEPSILSLAQASQFPKQHDVVELAIGAVADVNVSPLLSEMLRDESPLNLVIAKRLVRREAAANPDTEPSWLLVAGDSNARSLASAWIDGIERARKAPAVIVENFSPQAQHRMAKLVATAQDIASNRALSASERISAIRLAAIGDRTKLRELRDDTSSSEVQIAAIRVSAADDLIEFLDWLDSRIDQLPWSVSLASVQLALSKPSGQHWVLESLASNRLARGLLTASDSQRLLASKDGKVAKRAAEVLQVVGQDRSKVIERYRGYLSMDADAKVGQGLFVKHCSACHVIAGVGHHVGPDISDSRTQTPETLLVSILDPSRAIDAGFVRYSILTTDGRTVDGLLVDDRSDAVTLKVSGGDAVSINRDEIEQFLPRGVSLMPDGFEQQMAPVDVANLISYLKNWRYLAPAPSAAAD